ncbi:TIGR01244 family sulfur transferase [Aquibium sp. LZ166]|uniref:TIGR01244 family sulfur transferase n=1 Tax=Aquibium pacificus TaxID=3153579 RepID=A0ABV3SSB7_9HYPH
MKQVTEKLWIAPQPTAADLAEARAMGIKRVVNNRSDGEEPVQPTAAESAAEAAELGLSYVHIPVVPGKLSAEKVQAFQKALSEAEGPVLAHCKTGTRSLTLWTIGEVLDGRMTVADVNELGSRMGVDLAGAKNWLKANI